MLWTYETLSQCSLLLYIVLKKQQTSEGYICRIRVEVMSARIADERWSVFLQYENYNNHLRIC